MESKIFHDADMKKT